MTSRQKARVLHGGQCLHEWHQKVPCELELAVLAEEETVRDVQEAPWPFTTAADIAGARTQGTCHQDDRIPAGIQRALVMMRLSPGTQRPWGASTQPCPHQVHAAPPPSPRKPSRGCGDSRELTASLQGSPKTKEELWPFDYSEKDIS